MTSHGFVNAGDLLKVAEMARGHGGWVSFELLYKKWGDYAFAILEAAQLLGVLKWAREDGAGKTRVAYALGKRGAVLLNLLVDPCPIDAYIHRGVLRLDTPLGPLSVEPEPGYMLSVAYKLAEICGGDPRSLYLKLKLAVYKAVKRANGLEKWLVPQLRR